MLKHFFLNIKTAKDGLYEITSNIRECVQSENVDNGMCFIFIKHTSASLIIQENADPSAKHDLEEWLKKLVPFNDPDFTHTLEGPDDMPSHIKSVLTQTSLNIPIVDGNIGLGTWQGVYLWEHRTSPHNRKVIVSLYSD